MVGYGMGDWEDFRFFAPNSPPQMVFPVKNAFSLTNFSHHYILKIS
jgi:hypothetical protein